MGGIQKFFLLCPDSESGLMGEVPIALQPQGGNSQVSLKLSIDIS